MHPSETIQAALITAAATLAQALAAASPKELEASSVGGRQKWLLSAFEAIHDELWDAIAKDQAERA